LIYVEIKLLTKFGGLVVWKDGRLWNCL